MAEEFEYSAVRLTDRGDGLQAAARELSSALTRQGWSPLTVVTHAGVHGGGTWAYFKRPAALSVGEAVRRPALAVA